MIAALFLAAALALPSPNFTRPPIVSYQAVKTEQQVIKDLENWLKKNNPGAEVFIHKTPQVEKLRKIGYEKVPFLYRDMEIWIQRKPVHDKRGVNGNARIKSSA